MTQNKNWKNQKTSINQDIFFIKCKSRYLISQNVTFTQLYFLNFLIKIIFLFDQMIIKTDKHIINWLNKIKGEKIICKAAHIINIILK
jgi:hypothetical protein